MVAHQLIGRAVASHVDVVRDIGPEQLGAPTPCAAWNVRALIHHLLFWGPSLVGAGRKVAVPPPSEAESELDLTQGDWAGELVAQMERTAAAWSLPEAWQDTTRMGSPAELPAAMIGGMVLGEVVVHGWDLARATGQQPTWDHDVLLFLHREVAATAEMGRRLGIYGAEVPISAEAPLLHRILGLTGRDPDPGEAFST